MNSRSTAERLGRWEKRWASVMWFSTFFRFVNREGSCVPPLQMVSSIGMLTDSGSGGLTAVPLSAIPPFCNGGVGVCLRHYRREEEKYFPFFPIHVYIYFYLHCLCFVLCVVYSSCLQTKSPYGIIKITFNHMAVQFR